MILILYADDHSDRALALANAIGAQSAKITSPPVAKGGLDTLVVWGHGDIVRLCGLTSDDFVKLVKSWVKLNSGIKTLDIVTCNSRHAPSGYDSYSSAVVRGLKAGTLSSTRNVVVKAMPMNLGGSVNAFSILLAHAPNQTWCYITGPGPDDKIMFEGVNCVKTEANKIGYDLATAGNNVARDVKNRKFTLNYGLFNTLLANLVVVP